MHCIKFGTFYAHPNQGLPVQKTGGWLWACFL